MADETQVFQVRIPAELVEKIDALAEKELRPSRNNMVEVLLTEAVAKRDEDEWLERGGK